MDESNHDIVQMLTESLTTILNPLIQNTTELNQQMTAQMARMSDFLSVPQPHQHPLRDWMRENYGVSFEEDPTINQILQNRPPPEMVNQGVGVEPPRVEPQISREREPRIVMVNRNQNVDNVIRQIRHDEMATDNNLAVMVERIMV